MPIYGTQRIKKSPGCFRIDCRPKKYFSFQLAYVDFEQKYIIYFVSYAYVVQWNLLRRTSQTLSLVPAELRCLSHRKTDICKTDTYLRWTLWPVPRDVRLKEVLLYFLFLTFKARALMAQSNQNIRMKMGVADIRLVHSIRKHCGWIAYLNSWETNNYRYLSLRDLTTHLIINSLHYPIFLGQCRKS